MKFKTTKKAVMNGYDKIICVGYCSLQSLLHCESESAYTVRRGACEAVGRLERNDRLCAFW